MWRKKLNPKFVLKTAPTVEPITLAETKSFLRGPSSAEDADVTSLIVAARNYAEYYQNRPLITQTWELWLDDFPPHDCIPIRLKAGLQSVTSVKYYPDGGSETAFAAANYIVDTTDYVGKIVLNEDCYYPSVDLRSVNGVCVEFICGYPIKDPGLITEDPAGNVPEMTKTALKIWVAYNFENRDGSDLPKAVNILLGLNRVSTL
jgi:uncharacterized phiE125 gp8 family phage protein